GRYSLPPSHGWAFCSLGGLSLFGGWTGDGGIAGRHRRLAAARTKAAIRADDSAASTARRGTAGQSRGPRSALDSITERPCHGEVDARRRTGYPTSGGKNSERPARHAW